MNYANAGVSIANADRLVDWLKKTANPHICVKEGIGGYASVYFIGNDQYIAATTDGVGTKAMLAAKYNRLDTIGQDLVAMCVNDLACVGARPLFFLDYYATGKLDVEQAQRVISSLRDGCRLAGIPLVGGETAEMPGMYRPGDFDIAGFAVGIIDAKRLPNIDNVCAGDVVIGIHSNGLHSNGYSLVRRIYGDDTEWNLDWLLKPTFIYTNVMESLWMTHGGLISAAAHITGGGLTNINRVVPEHLSVSLNKWTWPRDFWKIQTAGDISDDEMLKTFICGIGMAVITSPLKSGLVQATIEIAGFKSTVIGRIEKS